MHLPCSLISPFAIPLSPPRLSISCSLTHCAHMNLCFGEYWFLLLACTHHPLFFSQHSESPAQILSIEKAFLSVQWEHPPGLPSTFVIPLYCLTVLPCRLYSEISKQWALTAYFIPWHGLPVVWLVGWLIHTVFLLSIPVLPLWLQLDSHRKNQRWQSVRPLKCPHLEKLV